MKTKAKIGTKEIEFLITLGYSLHGRTDEEKEAMLLEAGFTVGHDDSWIMPGDVNSETDPIA